MRGCIFIGFLMIFGSCDNHWDYYEEMDSTPLLQLMGPNVQRAKFLRDSVKKNQVIEIPFKIDCSSRVAYSYNLSDNYNLLVSQQTIQIAGLKESDNLILVSVEDAYHKKCMDTIHLTIFNNLPPIASLSYDVSQFDNSYTLTLDGSSSYDRDARFGGFITSYEYSINGQTYSNGSSKLKYSVIKGNAYTIRFRVQDNDSAWSNEIVTYIQI